MYIHITITQQQTCTASPNIEGFTSPNWQGMGVEQTLTWGNSLLTALPKTNIVPVPNSKQETAEAKEAIATWYLPTSILGSQKLPH